MSSFSPMGSVGRGGPSSYVTPPPSQPKPPAIQTVQVATPLEGLPAPKPGYTLSHTHSHQSNGSQILTAIYVIDNGPGIMLMIDLSTKKFTLHEEVVSASLASQESFSTVCIYQNSDVFGENPEAPDSIREFLQALQASEAFVELFQPPTLQTMLSEAPPVPDPARRESSTDWEAIMAVDTQPESDEEGYHTVPTALDPTKKA